MPEPVVPRTRLRSLALLLEPTLATGEAHRSQRLVQFLSGRAMLGAGSALMIFAGVGVGPWDSAYVAVSRIIGWQVGNVTIGVMAVLAVVALLLGVRPSLATVASFWVSGISINLTLAAASSFRWPGRTSAAGPLAGSCSVSSSTFAAAPSTWLLGSVGAHTIP
jgi:hypothetical protein